MRRQKKAGNSLLEVLVSLAILASVLPILVLANMRYAEKRNDDVRVIEALHELESFLEENTKDQLNGCYQTIQNKKSLMIFYCRKIDFLRSPPGEENTDVEGFVKVEFILQNISILTIVALTQ